jgi:nitroreductase
VAEPGGIEWVLTTTRAVRRRLDLTRPVDADVVLDCLEVALQAPTGGDAQGWRWIVITEPATKARVRDLYVDALTEASGGRRPTETTGPHDRMLEGAWYLANRLDQVPVLVVACIRGRLTPSSTPAQAASLYGSIYPAVWSLQLGLRARGLASVMTTVHLVRHREMAQLLGIPENVTQAALIPIAHLVGDELRPAHRAPVGQVAFHDRWDGPWTTEKDTDHPGRTDAPGADGGRAERP